MSALDKLNADGIECLGKKDLAGALSCFDKMLSIDGQSTEALSNRGHILCMFGRFEDASRDFKAALGIDDKNFKIWCGLSIAVYHLGFYEEALVAIDRSIALNGDYSMSHLHRSVIFRSMNKNTHEEMAGYNRSILLNPNIAEAYFNRGLLRLILGQFRDGFADYEYRLKAMPPSLCIETTAERWLGKEDLSDKSIMIVNEQGIGDTIQFMRYLTFVSSIARTVYVVVGPALVSLARDSVDKNVEVYAEVEDVPDHDYWCPLMSLPLAFGV
jgi:tetratricopeptide (TPR) repeat protein